MNTKLILVSLIAVFLLTTLVSASDLTDDFQLSVREVEVSTSKVISVDAGETIPLKVVFTANENASDVQVKVVIDGYRDDITAKTSRFEIIDGGEYTKFLSLKLPSDIELDPSDEYTLKVSIVSQSDGDFGTKSYRLRVQRDSYNIELLSVEAQRSVNAGTNLPVTVVLKNRGSERLDDLFVIASIPGIGVERKVYFSDLTPTDEDNDKEDAVERTIYLAIPSDAKSGEYTLEVSAYNPDAEASVTKKVTVVGFEGKSDVLATTISKDVALGGTVTYDLVLVNSGNEVAIYEITPDSVSNLAVSVDQPVVTVAAGSSKIVKVTVNAGNTAGTYSFGINVNSKGELVKRLTLTANVTGSALPSNIVVLTVVLAIIFIVLLIVLIVLLTRKPAKAEELGESYY